MSLRVDDPRVGGGGGRGGTRSRSHSRSGSGSRGRSISVSPSRYADGPGLGLSASTSMRQPRHVSPNLNSNLNPERYYYDTKYAGDTSAGDLGGRYASSLRESRDNSGAGAGGYGYTQGSSRYPMSSNLNEREAERKNYYYPRHNDDKDNYYDSDDLGLSEGHDDDYYDLYSDEDSLGYDDDDNEGLVYGDLPARRRGDNYVLSPSGQQQQQQQQQQQVPGGFPSYGRGQNPNPYVQHPTVPSPPPTSSSAALQSNWDPIPECELPGFVPSSSSRNRPLSQSQSQFQTAGGIGKREQSIPGAFPTMESEVSSVPTGRTPSSTSTSTFPTPQYAKPEQLRQSQLQQQQQQHALNYAQTSQPRYTTHTQGDTGTKQLYADLPQWQYAQIDPGTLKYSNRPTVTTAASTKNANANVNATSSQQPYAYTMSGAIQYPEGRTSGHRPSRGHSHSQSIPSSSSASNVTPTIRSSDNRTAQIGGHHRSSLSVSSANNNNNNNSHLMVADGTSKGRPPASPLLEPYKGTYQSISPMPSPIVVPSRDSDLDDDLSELEPLDISGGTTTSTRTMDLGRQRRRQRSLSNNNNNNRGLMAERPVVRESRHGSLGQSSGPNVRQSSRTRHRSRSRSHGHDHGYGHGLNPSRRSTVVMSPSTGRKKVTFYDPVPDAMAMSSALNHTRSGSGVDSQRIIRILPQLNNDEILALRKEYKNLVKLHGKGINIAKHLRLKLGNSPFGKVCYATALGRWESEAFWANCYYQGSRSRRELLIESLMGRTNGQMREIKECFRDSRYSDSLERCMRSELNADKFRTAILLALEGRRQSEHEAFDAGLVQGDVQELRRALVSRDGGETAMIYIVVLRSDSHLREVLRVYDKVYGQNLVRAIIGKSRNLVGEVLAHILNGAINRPMRDALLLHQALRESRPGRERSELLISRLVRLHWEPRHLELVKGEFRKRYQERVEEAIAEEVMTSSGGNEWGEFCIELARSGNRH